MTFDDKFSMISVIGLKTSRNSTESSLMLEKHLLKQKYSKGLKILRQGTPTNNTIVTPSEYSSSVDPIQFFDQEFLKIHEISDSSKTSGEQ